MKRFLVWFLLIIPLVQCDPWFLGHHLSSFSPYFSDFDGNDTKTPEGCSLLHFQMVARHGSRYPTSGDISKVTDFIKILDTNKHLIVNPNYQWLKTWENFYSLDVEGELAVSGEVEQYQLSQRLKQRFPDTFNKPYNAKVYDLQTTTKSRAAESATSFGLGMFSDNKGPLGPCDIQPFWTWSESKSLDLTLRFFSNCPKYDDWINSLAASEEQNKFKETFYPGVGTKIATKLGVNQTWAFSVLDVSTMFTLCAFDYVLQNRTDQWCSLFDEVDINLFEYWKDLDMYYNEGYGKDINYLIACPLLNDIISIMNSKINGDPDYVYQNAKLRFAHAETLVPLLSLLGLFKDEQPITWNSTLQVQFDRKWRTANMSPFSGNVVFILYKCNSGNQTTYKVRFLLNEKDIILPSCDGVFCDFDLFTKLYQKFQACPFNDMCSIEPPPSNEPSPSPSPSPSPLPTWVPSPTDPPTSNLSEFIKNLLPFQFFLIIGGAFVAGIVLTAIPCEIYLKRRIKQERNKIQYQGLVSPVYDD